MRSDSEVQEVIQKEKAQQHKLYVEWRAKNRQKWRDYKREWARNWRKKHPKESKLRNK